ncbi:hypothetical protein HPP92_012892 [Vanilla planifolia]|uniref:Uncharacterized protein n=1 Tax=Vanilla planifolia TaxID=51239 RepID=A0A835R1D7_VANPL|nr:hypothetical protein HPP92_012892 [Vanilla planifolia]
MRNRVRHRKLNPGEKEGIIEEMRFVTMRLRTASTTTNEVHEVGDSNGTSTWQPTMVGFLSYLVNSKLVFETLERIVEDSTDVSYAYFRRTGLERSVRITKDLEWFQQQGHVIPQPSSHGTAYASHLQRLAEKCAPSFLCHFYNIYFAHLYGGCGIGKQVCEKLLGGRNLEFYKWEGDIQDLLRNVRENINKLAKTIFARARSSSSIKECLVRKMSNFKSIAFVFLVILILGICLPPTCEGRLHLILERAAVGDRILIEGVEMAEGPVVADGGNAEVVATEDARPSVPGHSPGAGHSLHG